MERRRTKNKADLMFELAEIDSKIKALDALKKDRKAGLRSLIEAEGLDHYTDDNGRAAYTRRRDIVVVNPRALLKILTRDQLARIVRPDTKFVDACAEVGIDLLGIIEVKVSEDLRVEANRDAGSREVRKRMVEEQKQRAEDMLEVEIERLHAAAEGPVAEDDHFPAEDGPAKKSAAKKKVKAAKKAKVAKKRKVAKKKKAKK